MPRSWASTRTWALTLRCLAAPACARGAGLEFRGPRLGISPEQGRAAGFAKREAGARPAGAMGEVPSLTVCQAGQRLFWEHGVCSPPCSSG